MSVGERPTSNGWNEAIVAVSGVPVVWVESPLQFVAAAELAAVRRTRLRVVFRLGPQMSSTAAELLARGAGFASCTPYVGIPWGELARASEWIVGDGLSGQFRLAAAVLRPRAVTLLDDGTMTLRLAAGLAGLHDVERPEQRMSGVRNVLGGFTRDHLLRLASDGRLTFFSVFGREHREMAAVEALGARLESDELAWTRSTARPPRLPARRVLLGTARVVDGLLSRDDHLAAVARFAAEGSTVYLPHRRESAAEIAAVRTVAGVTVLEPGLPVELYLAGSTGLVLGSSGSTADTTLARVLTPQETSA
jgi:hypothetical protein